MHTEHDPIIHPARKHAGGMYRHAHCYILSLFGLVFAGFYLTYFSRLDQTSLLPHLHALTAIGWMTLLAVQSYAITHGKASWHRSLAKLSFVIMPILVVTGVAMVHRMLAGHVLTLGSSWTLRAFADFAALMYFLMQYSMGIVYRRDVRQHQRFMLATVFALFPPAMGRVIGLDLALRLGPWNMAINHAVGALIAMSLLIVDLKRERTVYFAYALALGFFLLLLVSIPILRHDTGWYRFCLWLGGKAT